MRIGIAQMGSRAGEFEETARRMVEYSRRAAEKDVDLLVFPMETLCGARFVPASDREGFLLDLAGCVLSLSEELACPCLVPVLTDMGGVAAPEAILLADGSVTPLGLASRLEALAASSAGKPSRRSEGTLPEVEFAGARLGIALTYEDLDTYDDYEYNVDVILFLSGYGFAVDDPSSALGTALSEGRFLADAQATGAWIVGVGSLGGYDCQVFCGSSFVLAPWGELAAQAPTFEEALLVCDVDPSAEGPLSDPLTPEVYDAPLMTWGALTMGISDAVTRAGVSGACAVARGDLSSMVALTLATDALGPTNVRVLLDPSDEGAASLVRALRVPEENVEELPCAPGGEALAPEEVEARLAMLARSAGCLAIGALDKTGRALEEPPAISAARLLPLGDLYRSDVVSLAHLRNTISPVIPSAALSRYAVPSVAGLEEAFSSDELRLEFVDLVVSSYVEWELPVSDIASQRGHAELVEAIVSRLRSVERSRIAEPLAITLSSKTLGEVRWPAGLAWSDRVRPEGDRLAAKVPAPGADAADDGVSESRPQAPEDSASHERDVRDLLGYLRDFSMGGGFSPFEQGAGETGQAGRHPLGGEPGGPVFWDSPFSEN